MKRKPIKIAGTRWNHVAILFCVLQMYGGVVLAQVQHDSLAVLGDSTKNFNLNGLVITASRTSESFLRSPVSIERLDAKDAHLMGAPTCFDAVENLKGVQMITPSLGFKVINTRGFANTTNVRFSQLIDGLDNQAPHIGAPIANALGANDLDIDKIEIIPGTASALYGLNAINGLANIQTKNPFEFQGLSVQQLTGLNHLGGLDNVGPRGYAQTNFRYAKVIHPQWAFKISGSFTNGNDWVADDRRDLAAALNASTGLIGADNPARDEVNGYGNESSNRRTLNLDGKKYVVARTGYREVDIADYNLQNLKGDAGLFWRPKQGHQLALTYKGALLNNVYQRSNRFRLQNYGLQQFAGEYKGKVVQIRSYLTTENTGKSFNMRSLAENMDRAYKGDDQWFADYSTAFDIARLGGSTEADAHQAARMGADAGRYEPGTDAYDTKKAELVNINNWDLGAALRVKSRLMHAEGLLNWDVLFPQLFESLGAQAMMGFDHRTYAIVPDGNYFINPEDSSRNLLYSKSGGFLQLNKDLLKRKLRLGATLRTDKADYFSWKLNPRFTAVYSPFPALNFRGSYQSGYRFPSIFEGFSNVVSGGVKRVGGLPVMSQGIFENSWTKASIDLFQAKVIADVNAQGMTQAQAIEANKGLLKRNPYTYLEPEFVRSLEFGVKGFAVQNRLLMDADFYYNTYDNFIAQVEASMPNTADPDSIPTYLNVKSKQTRYRLWTNSKSKIYNYGAGLGLRYRINDHLSTLANFSYCKLQKTDDQDGLEDGFNTPAVMVNATITGEKLWKNLGASVTGRYQTAFDYVSFLVSGTVPALWTLDAQVNYVFANQGITAKLGGTNFLNRGYSSLLGGPRIGGFYYLSLTWEIRE